jgi:hypothetical protein
MKALVAVLSMAVLLIYMQSNSMAEEAAKKIESKKIESLIRNYYAALRENDEAKLCKLVHFSKYTKKIYIVGKVLELKARLREYNVKKTDLESTREMKVIFVDKPAKGLVGKYLCLWKYEDGYFPKNIYILLKQKKYYVEFNRTDFKKYGIEHSKYSIMKTNNGQDEVKVEEENNVNDVFSSSLKAINNELDYWKSLDKNKLTQATDRFVQSIKDNVRAFQYATSHKIKMIISKESIAEGKHIIKTLEGKSGIEIRNIIIEKLNGLKEGIRKMREIK